MTKTCSRCGKRKAATAFKVRKNRLDSWCRSCYAETARQYYQSHHEASVQTRRAYRRAHIEDERQRSHEYYLHHKDEIVSNVKKWREQNSEKVRRMRRVEEARRRSRKNELLDDLTLEQWHSVIREFGGKCAYCGSHNDLQMDHFYPISKGGATTIANIVPACSSCNASKINKDPLIWMGV